MLFTRQTIIDIVKFIHVLIIIIVVFGPWYIKNRRILASILFFYIVLIVQWSVFDFCIITKLECALSNNELDISTEPGTVGQFLNKTIGLNSNDLKDIECMVLLLNGLLIHYKLMKLM